MACTRTTYDGREAGIREVDAQGAASLGSTQTHCGSGFPGICTWTTAARASHSRMKDLTGIFKNFEITPLADHHPDGAGRHSVCRTFSWPMNLMFSKPPYPSRLPGRSTLWPATARRMVRGVLLAGVYFLFGLVRLYPLMSARNFT